MSRHPTHHEIILAQISPELTLRHFAFQLLIPSFAASMHGALRAKLAVPHVVVRAPTAVALSNKRRIRRHFQDKKSKKFVVHQRRYHRARHQVVETHNSHHLRGSRCRPVANASLHGSLNHFLRLTGFLPKAGADEAITAPATHHHLQLIKRASSRCS